MIMKIKTINEIKQIFADDGKYLHKVDTEDYFKVSTMLPSETENDYEEIDADKYQEIEDLNKQKLDAPLINV